MDNGLILLFQGTAFIALFVGTVYNYGRLNQRVWGLDKEIRKIEEKVENIYRHLMGKNTK